MLCSVLVQCTWTWVDQTVSSCQTVFNFSYCICIEIVSQDEAVLFISSFHLHFIAGVTPVWFSTVALLMPVSSSLFTVFERKTNVQLKALLQFRKLFFTVSFKLYSLTRKNVTAFSFWIESLEMFCTEIQLTSLVPTYHFQNCLALGVVLKSLPVGSSHYVRLSVSVVFPLQVALEVYALPGGVHLFIAGRYLLCFADIVQ